MNKNKGIIGIGLVIAIVLGIVAVGGGTYYLVKRDSSPKLINPENILSSNENKELSTVENKKVEVKTSTTTQIVSECNSNSKPSIKVLSPNGGEEYSYYTKDGIESYSIPVLWESCNYKNTKNNSFLVKLINLNTGEEEIVDSQNYPSNEFEPYYKSYGTIDSRYLQKKGNYKILVCGAKKLDPQGFSSLQDIPDCSISDNSDNYFIYKTDSKHVEIKSIYKKENKYYIDVSYFEIITGEDAYTAQIKEGWCDKKEECIVDYYEKNLNENGTLEIDPNVDITVETYLGSDFNYQYKKLDKFVDYIKPGTFYLFYLKIEDNKVIAMSQFIGN